MSAIGEIKSLVHRRDPFTLGTPALQELQLEAARERFAEKRTQLRVLDKMARESGISEIHTRNDLVRLLFSHTNYKGYPDTFIDRGQWANMNIWFQTMTTVPVTDVDVGGIKDADDWMGRLRTAGHHVYASSGTSGKCSFLDQTEFDASMAAKVLDVAFIKALHPIVPTQDRIVYSTFPASGAHRWSRANAEFLRNHVGKPGEVHFLSDEPLRVTAGIRAGQLRRAMAAGKAQPDDLAAFEAENAARATQMQEAMHGFIDHISANRHKPLGLSLMWPQAYQIVQTMRARGVKDGDFHPDTIVNMGGGVKGIELPNDYREQVQAFFGVRPENYANCYGMVEVTALCPHLHRHGGWVIPPWIIPLVLDKSGTRLLNPEKGGVVEGRLALFDLMVDSRWGGVISGDKVTADFTPVDNLAGPIIRSVARYADLEEGEDKLSCAGTIDGYVRGEIKLGDVVSAGAA